MIRCSSEVYLLMNISHSVSFPFRVEDTLLCIRYDPQCLLFPQYYITSQFGTDCDQGMLFAVNVPADPANAQCIVPAGGPTAFASGPPGGTSTSTSENAAAAASGPPGVSPFQCFSVTLSSIKVANLYDHRTYSVAHMITRTHH